MKTTNTLLFLIFGIALNAGNSFASCTTQCIERTSIGNCTRYGRDQCGEEMKCIPHCTQRGETGNCAAYGADFCGTAAQCSTACSERVFGGDCASFGEDQCWATPVVVQSHA